MRKRSKIAVSISVVLIMLIAMATTVFAAGGELVPNVGADVSTAAPGDTVKFTVTLQGTGIGLEGVITTSSNLSYVGNTDHYTCSEGYIFTLLNTVTYEYKVRDDAVPGSPFSFEISNMQCADTAPIPNQVELDGTASAGGTIAAASVLASDISYATTAVTKTVGDAAFTNAITITAGNPANIQYTSSNVAVATVEPITGEVTIVAAGTATITATHFAGPGWQADTASYTLTVNSGGGGGGGGGETTTTPDPVPVTTPTAPQTGVYA